ncbi:MAG: flavin reductase family protein [Thermoanaerobaculaceae bacterium]|nr:flavin reductase family protein [Thermoanaerobaculaceae bacterium]
MEWKSQAPGSSYFYYPRLVCVIGVRDEAKATTNFAPVAWSTPLSSHPPLFGVCLSPATYTHHLVLATGEFTLNFLPHSQAQLADALGKLSGKRVDKVKTLALGLESGEVIATPFLTAGYAAAECSLVERHQFGDQTLLVGEVLRVHLLAGCCDPDGVLRLDRVPPLLYLGGNRYATTDPGSVTRPDGAASS